MPRIPHDQLRSISVPVALIWSRNDRITRFRIAEEASARFGWPLYPIHNCGHFAIGERPDAFVEALDRYGNASVSALVPGSPPFERRPAQLSEGSSLAGRATEISYAIRTPALSSPPVATFMTSQPWAMTWPSTGRT